MIYNIIYEAIFQEKKKSIFHNIHIGQVAKAGLHFRIYMHNLNCNSDYIQSLVANFEEKWLNAGNVKKLKRTQQSRILYNIDKQEQHTHQAYYASVKGFRIDFLITKQSRRPARIFRLSKSNIPKPNVRQLPKQNVKSINSRSNLVEPRWQPNMTNKNSTVQLL